MIGKFFDSADGVPETRRFKTGMDALDERLDSGLRPGQMADARIGPAPRSCEVLFLLDQSGSMEEWGLEPMRGYNRFLADMKDLGVTDAKLELMTFSDHCCVYESMRPMSRSMKLYADNYRPDGNTAIYDALCETILRTLARHAAQGRPQRTLVVMLTDGEENSSTKFTAEDTARMVNRARHVFGWEFVLIGVGVKADQIARDVGILPHLALSVGTAAADWRRAFDAATEASRTALTGQEIRLLPSGDTDHRRRR